MNSRWSIFSVLWPLRNRRQFEPGKPLAIIGPHLGQKPLRLAPTPGPTEADFGRTVWIIAQPGCGTGRELATLENDSGRGKKEHLILGAAAGFSGSQIRDKGINFFGCF
jgi:hypothetical protein